MAMNRVEKLFANSRRRQKSSVDQARRLLSSIPLESARDYLEVGCGSGAVTRLVARELRLQAIGIDIDRDQIALAAAEASGLANARFQVEDATRLPFADGSFDIALSFLTLHHIEDLEAAIREVARVLRPGGYFVYGDIFLPSVIARLGAVIGHRYSLPRSDRLLETFKSAGFVTIASSKAGGRFYGRYESVMQLRSG